MSVKKQDTKRGLGSAKKAFTLAEVLITLAIIGVVAAVTLPTVVANYQKKQTVTKLKKMYTLLNQVIQRAEAEYGETEGWDYKTMGSTDEEKYNYFIDNYLIKYLNVAKKCDFEHISECMNYPNGWMNGWGSSLTVTNGEIGGRSVLTSDGVGIRFWPGGLVTGSTYPQHMHFAVDLNGPKGKGIYGKDVFKMTINFAGAKHGVHMNGNTEKEPAARETLYEDCIYYGQYCGALIQLDNWEIKDDYPW